jgi:AcrR family transcriptional regulator
MPILGDMVRIGEQRPPALPSTSDQQARRAAILTAATRLGRIRALDRIHAREIAAEAGVALRTLYRYYPSKYHVYAAVLQSQEAELGASTRSGTGDDPAAAVAALMAGACRNMLRHEHLAHAMITSTQTVRAQTGAIGDHTVRDLIVRTAGVTDPTADQLRVARLIEQVTFGVLTWAVGGEVDAVDAVDDVRRACESLMRDAFG